MTDSEKLVKQIYNRGLLAGMRISAKLIGQVAEEVCAEVINDEKLSHTCKQVSTDTVVKVMDKASKYIHRMKTEGEEQALVLELDKEVDDE